MDRSSPASVNIEKDQAKSAGQVRGLMDLLDGYGYRVQVGERRLARRHCSRLSIVLDWTRTGLELDLNWTELNWIGLDVGRVWLEWRAPSNGVWNMQVWMVFLEAQAGGAEST